MRGALAGFAAVAVGVGLAAGAVAYVSSDSDHGQRLPERWQRGFNLTAFQPDAYGGAASERALLTARATGSDLLALVPTWYMASATASEVVADPAKTPAQESLIAAAAKAREVGLDATVKPHVDVADGSFRGEIAPADREAWFESYEAILLGYAELADRVDADALVIGTKLTSMTFDPEPWLRLIDAVEGVYDGPLTFAANWVDGAETISFWDRLDSIGIDAYMPLPAASEMPTAEQLVEAWAPSRARMADLSERWDMPIVFTELGYQSRLATTEQPGGGDGAVSEQAQAIAYEGAFRALVDDPWFEGIWWREWSAEGLAADGDGGGFTPEGKLASGVLAEWQGPPDPLG